ncbi:MAG TPA: oleate hydratase [Treponema sp.]|nr:oleate hydratase [Treponema sp.]
MKIYDLKYNAKAPEGIENRKAYIIGGGIAGLSAAVYLVDDIHMPGKNITILESAKAIGGSMDGNGAAKTGYLCRGERELEPNMECLWNICSKVPSLRNEGRTILDDIWDYNYHHPLHNEYRLVVQGKAIPCHDFTMDDECMQAMHKVLFAPESELEGKTIEDIFPESFFHANLWLTFHNMLAFKRYHSAIEAKRYFRRFTHFMPESDYEHGIIHTDLNEYDALILPIHKWLESKGVQFRTGLSVKEILMTEDNNTVTGLRYEVEDKEYTLPVAQRDMVLFTNGSMTQNSFFGDNKTVAFTDYGTENRGVFSVWEKLAKRDAKFGKPEKFIGDVDKSKWMSFFPTITDCPEFYARLERASGRPIGTSGIISFPESNWDISYIPYHAPYFPDQPANVQVGWGYGLYGEKVGNYVKKPMCECTGDEIMVELLFHFDMLDLKDELRSHTYVSTCMMPYITSQFMPREIADRPKVVPEGCTNLGFIGQFVETPEDAVFTVETSCRTGMYAAYALSGVEKKSLEVAPTFYDLRYIIGQIKKLKNIEGEFTSKDLPKVNPLKIKEIEKEALAFINNVEPYPSLFPGKVHK